MELASQYILWKYSQLVMPVKTGIQKTDPRPLTLHSGFATRHSAASARRRFAGMTKRGYNQDVPSITSSLFHFRSSFLSILDKSDSNDHLNGIDLSFKRIVVLGVSKDAKRN